MIEVKEYVNNGSDHLRGVTWTYTKRTPFAGEIITCENKRSIIEREALKYKEKNPDATALECYKWGKRFVNKERKHFKSYLKGLNSYTYRGNRYLVEDEERVRVFEALNEEFARRFEAAAKASEVKDDSEE